MASVIISNRNKAGQEESRHPEDEHAPELLSASEALISSIHSKDANSVADALKRIDGHMESDDASDEG